MRVGILFFGRYILGDAVVFSGAYGCKASLVTKSDKHPVDGSFGTVRVYGMDCFSKSVFVENLACRKMR